MQRRFYSCAAEQAAKSAVLQSLVHPTQLGSSECEFLSEAWKRSMLTLYRTILKLHVMKLQPVQREFGDKFVRAEFHRHITANEKYARLFYASWFDYVAQLDRGVTSRNLTKEEAALLSTDQKGKLTDIRRYVVQQKQTSGDFTL
eukprot:CAMPEP_0176424368 /NCGR_PEP_ID=MMETSP0127-20121128/10801_1 /TAXON_ID=938130 /ORGANISM="Platyophrya macrostoma, Strain WH" /LENGTH=144 /DNA_ID=CAMNT_0017805423 /DNA_START=90 /DNA_END=524 /DNA_ORIENTATION=+